MANKRQASPDWFIDPISIALGYTQANIERFAASYGIPAGTVAHRLGTILSGTEDGSVLGADHPLPSSSMSGHSTARGGIRKSTLALAGNTHSGEALNGHTRKPGEIKELLLAKLSQSGKMKGVDLVRALHADRPDISVAAFNGCLNGLRTHRMVKTYAGGLVASKHGKVLVAKERGTRRGKLYPTIIKLLSERRMKAEEIRKAINKSHPNYSDKTIQNALYNAKHRKAFDLSNDGFYSLTPGAGTTWRKSA